MSENAQVSPKRKNGTSECGTDRGLPLAYGSLAMEPGAVRFLPSVNMTSHLGRFRFDDLDVDLEVMGAVDKLLADGSWTGPTDPSQHLVEVTLGDRRVPVLSLKYEADAYEMLGRHERARLLRDATGQD